MLRGVLIGLMILVLVVFAYVGYSSYATGRSAGSAEAYTDGMAAGRAKTEPMGSGGAASTMPAMPATGEGAGGGLVAQGGGAASATGMVPPTYGYDCAESAKWDDVRGVGALSALSAGRPDVAAEYGDGRDVRAVCDG